MKILVATNFSTRSQRAVRRAGLMARQSGGELTLVHVVDDAGPSDVIAQEIRESKRMLEEQIEAMPELRGLPTRAFAVEGDAPQAILRAAKSAKSALIVMGAYRRRGLQDLLGTTIDRVVRKGSLPVLMVNREADRPYRTAVAAVDVSSPSANALRTGAALGLPSGAQLTLVHAYLAPARGRMAYAAISSETIERYVDEEGEHTTKALVDFLHDNHLDGGLGDDAPSMRVEEGAALPVIAAAVEQLNPDVLIIGTQGRSLIAKTFLGSVAEEVLRSLPVDILAVPPGRPHPARRPGRGGARRAPVTSAAEHLRR